MLPNLAGNIDFVNLEEREFQRHMGNFHSVVGMILFLFIQYTCL